MIFSVKQTIKKKIFKKILKRVAVLGLVLIMLLSNIPLGAVDYWMIKLSERNIVDAMWQAQNNSSVVDLFKPSVPTAKAAQVNVNLAIPDATDEFGPSPTVVFTGPQTGYNFFVKTDVAYDTTMQFGASPATVFISDQIGYVFYVDINNDLVYKKTTNGGTNWSGARIINDTITGWITTAVWYDQWTPDDTTGTLIHIAAADTASDDIYYTYLDTDGDTLKGSMVTAVSGTATLTAAADGPPSITKSAEGNLFISANFTSAVGGKVSKSDVGVNWGDTWNNITPSSGWSTVAADQIQLLPLKTDDDIIAIKAETATDTINYKVYDEQGNSWDESWTNIATLYDNATDDQWFSATIKKSTGDVYLAFANRTNNSANNVEFWSLDESAETRVFAKQSNLFVDNDATVMAPVPLMDENTGDIYVAYLRGTLANTMDVYFKKSTDGGQTWGEESTGLSPGIIDDHKAMRGNLLNTERLYLVWYNDDLNDLMGNTVADISPPASITQAAYRWFGNDNITDVGEPLAIQDTAATLANTGEKFRLRLLLSVSVSDLGASGENFKLQFAGKGAGNCAEPSGGVPSTYTDVGADTAIAYYNNDTPTDGAALTANENDPTNGGEVIANQTYEEQNNFTNAEAEIGNGENGLWDFALQDYSAGAATNYCFRVVTADGEVLDGYDVYPEIITATVLVNAPEISRVNLNRTVVVGQDVNFRAYWTDGDEGESAKLKICKTDALTDQNCNGGYWASSTDFVLLSLIDTGYTAVEDDIGGHYFYTFVCDDDGNCSESWEGIFSVRIEDESAHGVILQDMEWNVSGGVFNIR